MGRLGVLGFFYLLFSLPPHPPAAEAPLLFRRSAADPPSAAPVAPRLERGPLPKPVATAPVRPRARLRPDVGPVDARRRKRAAVRHAILELQDEGSEDWSQSNAERPAPLPLSHGVARPPTVSLGAFLGADVRQRLGLSEPEPERDGAVAVAAAAAVVATSASAQDEDCLQVALALSTAHPQVHKADVPQDAPPAPPAAAAAVQCPVCGVLCAAEDVERHANRCLDSLVPPPDAAAEDIDVSTTSGWGRRLCPVGCGKYVAVHHMYQHVERCVAQGCGVQAPPTDLDAHRGCGLRKRRGCHAPGRLEPRRVVVGVQ